MTAASRPSTSPRAKRAAPTKPRLRLVGKKAPTPAVRRSTAGTIGTLAVVLTMLLAFGAVAVQTLHIQQRLGIQATSKATDEARAEQADLLLQVAELEAPARILEEAHNRLGMIPPADRPFLAAHPPGDLERPIEPPEEGVFAGPDEPGSVETGVTADGSAGDATSGTENE